jgi:hypothetical protein
MTARQVTKDATEADLEARIDATLHAVFPWLDSGALQHQLTFSFDLGHSTIPVDGATVSLGQGRLDILVLHNETPLAILELKRPSLALAEADTRQGLSYARMMDPRPPLVVVTNGDKIQIYETHSGGLWQPETHSEEEVSKLFTAAAMVAAADRKHAVATLLGPDSRLWVTALRMATRATIEDMSGSWTDPEAIFVPEFHIPRAATEETMTVLRSSKRIVLVEGPPLVGKSHILRELAERTARSDDVVLLLIEAGGDAAGGIFQALANLLASALGWSISSDEVRPWLERMSHGEGPALVIALDGLSLQHDSVQQEIAQLSSAKYGDRLKLVIEADSSLADRLFLGANRRKSTPLARRGTRIEVASLSDDEFRVACQALANNGIAFMEGAQHAEEYRQPWVLRALGSEVADAPERAQGMTAVLPPLLSLDLISRARERFGNPELRALASQFAAALVDDYATGGRSPELTLRSMHHFMVRRSNMNRQADYGAVKEMIEVGLARVVLGNSNEAIVVGRMPELIASELSLLLANELNGRLREPEPAADWLVQLTSKLPLGDIIGAHAMLDMLPLRQGLPLDFLTAMLCKAPKIEPLQPGMVMASWIPNIGQVEFAVGDNGRVTISRPGMLHRFEIDDEEAGHTYADMESWQILSHLGGYPIEIPMGSADQPRPRLDPAILSTVGASRVPLRRPGEDPQKTALLVHALEGGGETVCDHAGIVEPITFSLLRFLESEQENANDWLAEACEEGERPLLARVALVLRFLSARGDAALAQWARGWRTNHVLPALNGLTQ